MQALDGIRVLDFSRYRAGPVCGQILGDMGAEVVRVERPGGEDDRKLEPFPADGNSLYLLFTARNKKCITLNLASPEGRQILEELVNKSDVVIENYGPVTNVKLGLDYASLKKIKPDIIVTSVSAYGQYGPYANRLGFDGIAQAMSGLMSVTGFPDGMPTKSGVSFVDTASGYFAALGTMLALFHRQRTGAGQLVDISLFDTALSFMESYFAEYEVGKQVHPRVGNAHTYCAPVDSYKARDGYFFVHVVGDAIWRRFVKSMDIPEIAGDGRFRTDAGRSQPENRAFFAELVNKWAADKTVREVVEYFNGLGVPCGEIRSIPDVVADPHVKARDMIVPVEHPGFGRVPLIGIPIKLSQTPGSVRKSSPELGEHNGEIYAGLLGYSGKRLEEFRKSGVI